MGTIPLLVDTTWLAAHLDDPDLRILDSTTNVIREPGKHDRVVAERGKFEAGHIPGAQFVDLQADLSDPHSHLNFTAPSADDFARAIERFGIGDDSRVVVYGTGSVWWATRVWWLVSPVRFRQCRRARRRLESVDRRKPAGRNRAGPPL